MTNKELVIRFFEEGYVNKDFNYLYEIMADDYLDHSPCHATSNKECIDVLKNTAALFGNMKVRILDLIEENDKVAARIRFQCIHSGDGYGIPATNRMIIFEALEYFRIADGKIAESWGYWPDSEILEQLK